jgi:ribosomal protein L37AE/L43A
MTYDQWKTRSPDDEQFRGQPCGENCCEKCDSTRDVSENEYGEFICDNCEQNAAEAAYERQCEDFHDGGSSRFITLEQRMSEARRLK